MRYVIIIVSIATLIAGITYPAVAAEKDGECSAKNVFSKEKLIKCDKEILAIKEKIEKVDPSERTSAQTLLLVAVNNRIDELQAANSQPPATSPQVMTALANELLAKLSGEKFFWSAPPNDQNLAAAAKALIGLIEPITERTRHQNPKAVAEAVAAAVKDVFRSQPDVYLVKAGSIEASGKNIQNDIFDFINNGDSLPFTTYANSIVELFPTGDVALAGARRRAIQNSAEALLELDKLQNELAKLKLPTPLLHIFAATYGDVRRGAAADRRCDARLAVRTTCEGKASCTKSDVAGTDDSRYCGFDPVPSASDDLKKLSITYGCIKDTKANWDKVLANPNLKARAYQFRQTVTFGAKQTWELKCEAASDGSIVFVPERR